MSDIPVSKLLSKWLFRGDRTMWVLIVFFLIASVLTVTSASSTLGYKKELENGFFYTPILRHAFFVLTAFVVCVIGSWVHPRHYARVSNLLVFLSIVLLVFTLFAGKVNDGARWLDIGGVKFQPSELARLSLINFVAFRLGGTTYSEKNNIITVCVVSALVIGLILWENFSTSVILALTVLVMLILGRVPWRYLWRIVAMAGSVVLVLGILMFVLPKPIVDKIGRFGTARSRIETYMTSPSGRTDSAGPDKAKEMREAEDYQITQSKIAQARGGLVGVGPGNSEMRHLLPNVESDFIYALIVEEYGLIGGLVIIFLYVVFFFRTAVISRSTKNMYLKLMLFGIGFIIMFQASVNLSVATGLIPVTGQNLPFISRGGTSYMVTSIYFAIILSVSELVRKEKEKEFAQVKGASIDPIYVETGSIPEVDHPIYGIQNDTTADEK